MSMMEQGFVPGDLLPDGWIYVGSRDDRVLENFTPEEEEIIKQREYKRCGEALRYYNETKGEDYEMVKCLEVHVVFMGPYTCWHFNFEAKNSTDDSTKLFFAEYCERFVGPRMDRCVNHCMILDPSTAVRGCEACADIMLHPPNLIIKRPTWWEGQ